jgi:pectate lyase C
VGATVEVNATIDVAGGQTFDGHCQRYSAGSSLVASASSARDDTPMFRLEAGARLQNVVLDASEVDGVHTYGDAQLSNIVWEQIGDDALTTEAMGTVTVAGGSAAHAPNAVFQLNAAGTLRLSNFRATDAGKLIRQNNAATYRVDVFIDRCDISAMTESIFRTDSSTSTVTMTNTRYSMIAGELFLGVNPANITLMDNTEY